MKNSIVRYLKSGLTGKEKKELIAWTNASKENRQYFEEMEDAWLASAISNEAIFDKQAAWESFRRQNVKPWKKYLLNIQKYAAIILFFILTGWFGHILYSSLQKTKPVSYMELSVSTGETAHFQFADQTKIQLNAESHLSFPEHFQDNQREVFLRGEAYFRVKKDEERPFVVHAGDLELKVTGTSFNIKSYPEEDIVETTLEEGMVQVSSNRRAGKFLMRPGQHLVYNKKTVKFQLINNADIDIYTSWTKGRYKFNEIKLDRLVRSIERLYDVDIELKEPGLKDLTYTGSFYKSESALRVLKMIQMSSLGVHFEQQANNQFIITKKQNAYETTFGN